MRQELGEYKEATTAYKRAIAETPAADLGLLEVSMVIPIWPSIRWPLVAHHGRHEHHGESVMHMSLGIRSVGQSGVLLDACNS